MNFEEHAAKPLLRSAGIATPDGEVVTQAAGAGVVAARFDGAVVKAQAPSGKRGKAGGIKVVASADEAVEAAEAILGMSIGGYRVERLLVEAQVDIVSEYYVAVLNDPETKGPLVLFSPFGGMDIEEIALEHPDAIYRYAVDIREGFRAADAQGMFADEVPEPGSEALGDLLERLYNVYRDNDAELLEINPLVVTSTNELVALDCKFTLDDSAIKRREALAANGVPEQLCEMEFAAKQLGFKYIDLEGEIGVLANGAGLTMTTMDVVEHYGAKPANFLEIGGDAYTLAKPALELLLTNPRITALVVNFCGAFARTDVMVEGVVAAWKELAPTLPVFFSVHGTGEEEAVAMLRAELNLEPYDTMDEAIQAAIASTGANR